MISEDCFNLEAPLNQAVRYRHSECSEGKDRALIVTRTKDGWIWWCHRCKKGGFRNIDGLPPQQIVQWIKSLRAKPHQKQEKIKLPKDFTCEIPPEGWAWLFKAGLHEHDVQRYRIGYSRQLHRVILPVYTGSPPALVYWQGRSLVDPTPENPKYMNVYQKNREGIYFRIQDGLADVVLVEDILSCIRVSKVMDCIALLYAHVPDKLVFGLKRDYETIWLWLDSDKTNHMVGRVMRYRSLGINVRMVRCSKDPKYYSESMIEEKLK